MAPAVHGGHCSRRTATLVRYGLSCPDAKKATTDAVGLPHDTVTLYDPDGILVALRSQLYPYPQKLKRTLITESLVAIEGSLGDLRDYTRRGIGNSASHLNLERILDSLSRHNRNQTIQH